MNSIQYIYIYINFYTKNGKFIKWTGWLFEIKNIELSRLWNNYEFE